MSEEYFIPNATAIKVIGPRGGRCYQMDTQGMRKLEDEIARVRAKLAQLETQLEKAKEFERRKPEPTAPTHRRDWGRAG